jgi:hypothetical protein
MKVKTVAIPFLILLTLGFLTLKACLLMLVLGWVGVAAFGFWKAVVAILLLDLLLYVARD